MTGRTLLLVEVGPDAAALEPLWRQSEFWDRLLQLGHEVVAWADVPSDGIPERVVRYSSWDALIETGADSILLLEGSQLFADEMVLGRLVRGWQAHRRAFSTQWEHARLPIGIGGRLASLEALSSAAGATPSERFQTLAIEADDAWFDPVGEVGFESSLLDARLNSAIMAELQARPPKSWDLAGFLDFASETEQSLEFAAPTDWSGCTDERGLPVRYGFESRACADFPSYVMFDLTNVCNAKCTHCPHGIPEMRDKMLGNATRLDGDRFRQVIDECVGRDLDFVRITADGEPLLHKELFDLIRYAKDRDVGPIGLTTNASLLDERRARLLIESGVDMIDVSLDAVRPETYAVVRVGLRHDKVYGNLERLLQLREEYGADLKVIVSFVQQASNEGETEEFRDYWEGKVDQVVIREMISNVNLNEVDRADRVAAEDRWPCPHWFRRVVINYDGWLKACPIDWTGDTKVAPPEGNPIHDVWHGTHYWQNRIEHLNRMFSPTSACAPCQDWLGTPWNLGYEKMVKNLGITAGAGASAGAAGFEV